MAIEAYKLWITVGATVDGALSGLRQTESGLDRLAAKMRGLGFSLSAGVTLPLVQAGKDMVGLVVDYEKGMNILGATTNATAEQMGELGELAKELGADLSLPGTSAVDASQAMTELGRAGLSLGDIMDSTRGVLQLSAAGQLDNAEAARITANALNAFGLAGSEATRVADLLAAGANASTADVKQMADALQMSAAVAASAEIPIEDLTTMIAEMANQGIQGSDAGTSLKQMILSLQAPTNKASEQMQRLGITIYDARGNMLPMRDIVNNFSSALSGMTQEQRNAALATIFGSDAVRAANIVLIEGADAWDEMKDAVTEEGAAAKLAAAAMEGLPGALENLKSASETARMAAIEPLIDDIISMTKILTDAANAYAELSEGTRDFIGKLVLFAGALGPVIVMGSGLVHTYKLAQGPFGRLISNVGSLSVKLLDLKPALDMYKTGLELGMSRTASLRTAVMNLQGGLGSFALKLGVVTLAIGLAIEAIRMLNQVNQEMKNHIQAVKDAWGEWFKGMVTESSSATDITNRYIQQLTYLKNLRDGMGPLARAAVGADDINNFRTFSDAISKAAKDYSEYRTSAERVAKENGLLIDSEGNLVQMYKEGGAVRHRIIEANYVMSESEYELMKANELVNKTIYDGTQAGLTYAGAANDVAFRNKIVQDSNQGVAESYRVIKGAALEVADIFAIANSTFEDLGYTEDEILVKTKLLEAGLGDYKDAQTQLREDTELLIRANKDGLITDSEMVTRLQQVRDGTFTLADAKREEWEQTIRNNEKERERIKLMQEEAMHMLELRQALSETWDSASETRQDELNRIEERKQKIQAEIAELSVKANMAPDRESYQDFISQINDLKNEQLELAKATDVANAKFKEQIELSMAQTAMSELKGMMDAGKIDPGQYIQAVEGIQQAFGLVNDQGINMAKSIALLDQAFSQHKIAAEEYGTILKGMTDDLVADGQIDLTQYAALLGLPATAMQETATLVKTAVDETTTAVKDAGDGLVDHMSATKDEATAAAKTGAEAVESAWKDKNWVGLGENIGAGIAQGIQNQIPNIAGAGAAAAQAAETAANQEAQTHSPSKKLEKTGYWMMMGLQKGIVDNAKGVVAAMREATQRTLAGRLPIADSQRDLANQTRVFNRALAQASSAPAHQIATHTPAIYRPTANEMGNSENRPSANDRPIHLAVNVGNDELRRVVIQAMARELSI